MLSSRVRTILRKKITWMNVSRYVYEGIPIMFAELPTRNVVICTYENDTIVDDVRRTLDF